MSRNADTSDTVPAASRILNDPFLTDETRRMAMMREAESLERSNAHYRKERARAWHGARESSSESDSSDSDDATRVKKRKRRLAVKRKRCCPWPIVACCWPSCSCCVAWVVVFICSGVMLLVGTALYVFFFRRA